MRYCKTLEEMYFTTRKAAGGDEGLDIEQAKEFMKEAMIATAGVPGLDIEALVGEILDELENNIPTDNN